MKIKFLLGIAALVFFTTINAQGVKIGYTNAEVILSLLPEARQIDADLKAYETQLQNQWF